MHSQYITFSPRRDGFLLFSDYDERLIDKLRNDVSGAKWLSDSRAWFVPNLIIPAQQLLDAVHDFPIPLDDAGRAAMARLSLEAEFFERLSNAKELEECAGLFTIPMVQTVQAARALVPKIFPFQLAGIVYATQKQRCFIGDDMGTGKTLTALTVLRLLQGFPALVICKKSAVGHWHDQADLWTPGLTIKRWSTKHGWPTGSDADLTIMTWGQLSLIAQPESGKGKRIGWAGEAIVFDEIHRAKDRTSKRTQKAIALSNRVRIRLGVTGSIDLNGKPIELVSQLSIIGRMKDMGGFWPFVKRYCGAVQGRYGWEMDGATNLEELARKLRQVCFVRRKKTDVLPQLPPKRREMIRIELPEKLLLTEYRKAEQELLPKLKQRSLAEAQGLIDFHLKHLVGRAKVPAIVEWIGDFLEDSLPEEKLVVFAWHQDVIAGIVDGLTKDHPERSGLCATLTGKDSEAAREKAQKRFREDPACRIFVANIEAGGESIELFSAATVLFAEFGWTPGGHDQAEDRLWRMGQEKSVIAYYFVAIGTVDEPIYELVEEKRKNVDQMQDSVIEKLLERLAS
jgi:SWI/SNF-related matrix-associated actin-dependent regulator of chromatin subfamily A-like protein 1